MSIPAPELASLIEQAAVGAAPNEEEVAHQVAEQIRHAGRGAHLHSQSSKSLHSMIASTQRELGEEALRRLAQVEIYGEESLYINAIPNMRRRVKRIIVFDGLKHLIHYHTDLIKVLDRLQVHRPDAQYELPDGSTVAECLAFSMAGFSILSDFLETLRTPVAIHDMLGPRARAEVVAAFRGALCFVLLHELAHIELGHLSISGVNSERLHFSLLEREAMNACKEDELAADAFAIGLIPSTSQAAFTPSLVFLLGAFAFLEVFSGNLSANHPLAVNRLSRLVDLCRMAPDEKSILVAWIEQQIQKFRNLSDDRASGGGSIRNRIEAKMPVQTAYRILIDIKQRVGVEHGCLEADA